MQLFHHHQVDAQTQTRHFPRLLEYLPQPRRRGRGGRGAVWRQLSVRRPCDRHVYLPSIIALIVGFIGLRYGSDSPESYGLGTAEELFGEAISEEDKETEENAMTKWQIFVEYVLKNKVIWLLCFSNIFLYVVRIGIDQWSTVYAFRS